MAAQKPSTMAQLLGRYTMTGARPALPRISPEAALLASCLSCLYSRHSCSSDIAGRSGQSFDRKVPGPELRRPLQQAYG